MSTSRHGTWPTLRGEGLRALAHRIYLYAWPYQQAVRGVLGPSTTWWQVMLLAGIASTLTAYASWHLVERPALRLKASLLREPAPALTRTRPAT